MYCTPGLCSFINSATFGSTLESCGIDSCAKNRATILRTAEEPRRFRGITRSGIHASTKDTVKITGVSPPAMDPDMAHPPLPVQSGNFLVTPRGARPGGQMTGPSRRRRHLDPCPSSPRLPYPPFEIFV